MENLIPALLLALFVAHLVGFTVLGLRRREWYYAALVTTFALLSVAIATQLFWPQLQIGDWPLHRLLRYCAWAAAAVSISWTIRRAIVRRRAD